MEAPRGGASTLRRTPRQTAACCEEVAGAAVPTRLSDDRAQATSRPTSIRFAPAIAPTMAVTSAARSVGRVEAEPRADERTGDRRGEPGGVAPGRPVGADPGEEDPEPDRHADGQQRQQLVVEGDAGHRREHDEDAEEPAAEPEHDRVQRPEHGTALAPVATASTHAERHPQQREDGQRRQPEHDAEQDPRDRAVAERGREVDRRRRRRGTCRPGRSRGTC